jgi:hypothetical protein
MSRELVSCLQTALLDLATGYVIRQVLMGSWDERLTDLRFIFLKV